MQNEKIQGRGWTIISVGWAAYLISNLISFALGMMLPSMREDIGFGLEVSGYLSSIGWIFKAICLIPCALLVTKVRPKYVLMGSYFFTGLALVLQGAATTPAMLLVGRGLMSIASAGILSPLVPIKIAWVPKEKIVLVNGLENCVGPIGQAMGTAAIAALFAILGGWRSLMYVLGGALIVLCFLMAIFYKEREGHEWQKSDLKFLEPLKEALKVKEVWLLALGWPGTSLVWIAFYTFWPTFAMETYGMSLETTGWILGLFPIFSAIASFTAPHISKLVGYDRLMMWPWGFILPIAYFAMLQTDNIVILCIFSIIAGFGAYAWVPTAFSVVYKLGLPPRTVTLGTSVILTMVSVGSTLGGTLAGTLGASMGLYKAMALCCLSPLPFAFLTMMLPEKGWRAMAKAEKK